MEATSRVYSWKWPTCAKRWLLRKIWRIKFLTYNSFSPMKGIPGGTQTMSTEAVWIPLSHLWRRLSQKSMLRKDYLPIDAVRMLILLRSREESRMQTTPSVLRTHVSVTILWAKRTWIETSLIRSAHLSMKTKSCVTATARTMLKLICFRLPTSQDPVKVLSSNRK